MPFFFFFALPLLLISLIHAIAFRAPDATYDDATRADARAMLTRL